MPSALPRIRNDKSASVRQSSGTTHNGKPELDGLRSQRPIPVAIFPSHRQTPRKSHHGRRVVHPLIRWPGQQASNKGYLPLMA